MRIAIAVMLTLLAPAALAAQDREVVRPEGAAARYPFTPGIRTGNLVFAAGQLGVPPGQRDVVAGGIGPETRQALENLDRIFKAAGTTLQRAVKCTVFLADIADFAAMNAAYAPFFTAGELPARSTIAASGLVANARVEIECIAVVTP
jgi:2-iminobutanoate/2-iminopropanoate deaminase